MDRLIDAISAATVDEDVVDDGEVVWAEGEERGERYDIASKQKEREKEKERKREREKEKKRERESEKGPKENESEVIGIYYKIRVYFF